MKLYFVLLINLFIYLPGSAQTERGKSINAPKIIQNRNTQSPSSKNQESEGNNNDAPEFIYEDQAVVPISQNYSQNPSNIRFGPLKKANPLIQDDTTAIDEGDLLVVEIEEEAQFNGTDDMVEIASYYSVWDTETLDPYGIDPKEFNENITLKLYNESEGRNWAPVLDQCELTSHFGWRWRRWHRGTDLDLETGDPVYAPFDGIIRVAGVHSGYGRTVLIRHYNGLETLFGHMSKIHFEANTIVKAGEAIGFGGNTGRSSGSHLHFETRYEGNQFDPENIFNFSGRSIQIKGKELQLSSRLYDYLRGKSSRPANVISGRLDIDEFAIEDEDEPEEVPVKMNQKVWYTVSRGDNLINIAKKFKIPVAELAKLNKISTYKKINVGVKLRVR